MMGYYIYRGLSSNGSFTKLNMIPNAATVYTDYSVSAGQTYYYYVTAVSTLGQSTISNVVQAIVPSP